MNSIKVTVTYLTDQPRWDILEGTLAALHERTGITKHTLYANTGVVEVGLWIDVAGPGETRDIVARLTNAPGLPPRDVLLREG